MSKFRARLDAPQPLLLDGGLATQLESQGHDLSNPLWSASLLQSDPQAIVAAHIAYLNAGAECLLTASYQASRDGFAQRGITSRAADALMLSSVDLLLAAKSSCRSNALVAASLGPYGATLHDGSEYHGDYGVADELLANFHRPRLALFDAADVDVLAVETIPSLQEAQVLAALLPRCNTPSWVSFSCRDEEHISDGTPLREVAKLFAEHPSVCALGINCTSPRFVVELVTVLRAAAPDKHIVAYPNSGESYDAAGNVWRGLANPIDFAAEAARWVAAGASAVGGCCRVGPEHVTEMAAALSEEKQ